MDINHALICPVNNKPFTGCPCKDYAKWTGEKMACDWPFKNGLTLEQIKKLREGLHEK
jgi:hypothetical protein